MSESDRLVREFIHMCGKMDIESLKELRSACAEGPDCQWGGAKIGKFICRTVIDLVIEKKREKLINGRCEIATES